MADQVLGRCNCDRDIKLNSHGLSAIHVSRMQLYNGFSITEIWALRSRHLIS